MSLTENLSDETFLLANIDFAGFYSVNYDEENWKKIIKQLHSNKNVSSHQNNQYFLKKALFNYLKLNQSKYLQL